MWTRVIDVRSVQVWLCLNHIQFFVSRMVYHWFKGRTNEQEINERKRQFDQRELMTKALFPSADRGVTYMNGEV
jgi:hypothetical protein